MMPHGRTLYQSDPIDFLSRVDSGIFRLIHVDPAWGTKFEFEYPPSDSAESNPDISLAAYQQYLSTLAQQCWRVLHAQGTLFCHLPPTGRTEYRLILNQCFGTTPASVFIWPQRSRSDSSAGPAETHEELLRYTKSAESHYEPVYRQLDPRDFPHTDHRGQFKTIPLYSGVLTRLRFQWRGHVPPVGRGWRYGEAKLQQLHSEHRIDIGSDGTPRLKVYFAESTGNDVGTIWDDLPPRLSTFETEMPPQLYDRLISIASRPGDLVFDPQCDTGGFLNAASRLNREWVGCTPNESSLRSVVASFAADEIAVRQVDPLRERIVNNETKDVFTDIETLRSARSSLSRFQSIISELRNVYSDADASDDEIIEAMGDVVPRLGFLLPETARRLVRQRLSVQLELDRLESSSQQFIETAVVVLQLLGDDFDFATASTSAWKAVENELVSKFIHPFFEWISANCKLKAGDLERGEISENGDIRHGQSLVDAFKKSKPPPIGNIRYCLEAATNAGACDRSLVLKLLNEFKQKCFLAPDFWAAKGDVFRLVSQDAINKYRNGAAHTSLFSRRHAQESVDYVLALLPKLLVGLRRRADFGQ